MGAVSTKQMKSSTQEAFNRAESYGPPKPALELSEALVKTMLGGL